MHADETWKGDLLADTVKLGDTDGMLMFAQIFWIPKPDSQERSVNTAYYEIPELLYVDHGWSDMDVTVWKKLSHLERLTALNCRAGGLDFDEVVIAISMRFARAETELIHLNATPKCHLALFIDHEVHMGRYADLLNDGTQDAGRAQNVSSAYNRPTNRVNKGDKQEYRYYSLLYMMDAIDDYLYTCQSPLSYKIVAEGIIDAHHKWNQQRMAASNLGNNDSANAVRLAPQA